MRTKWSSMSRSSIRRTTADSSGRSAPPSGACAAWEAHVHSGRAADGQFEKRQVDVRDPLPRHPELGEQAVNALGEVAIHPRGGRPHQPRQVRVLHHQPVRGGEERDERLPRVAGLVREHLADRSEEVVVHRREQLVLVGDVGVERHRIHPQPAAHAPERHRGDAVLPELVECGAHHLLTAEAARGSAASRRPVLFRTHGRLPPGREDPKYATA